MTKELLRGLSTLRTASLNEIRQLMRDNGFEIKETDDFGDKIRFSYLGAEFLMLPSLENSALVLRTYEIGLQVSAPYPTYQLMHWPSLDCSENTSESRAFISDQFVDSKRSDSWISEFIYQIERILIDRSKKQAGGFSYTFM